MASCWRRARISAISSTRGAKNERARVRRKGKRAINEKKDHEIWIRKVGEKYYGIGLVSASIQRSDRDFRYLQAACDPSIARFQRPLPEILHTVRPNLEFAPTASHP